MSASDLKSRNGDVKYSERPPSSPGSRFYAHFMSDRQSVARHANFTTYSFSFIFIRPPDRERGSEKRKRQVRSTLASP